MHYRWEILFFIRSESSKEKESDREIYSCITVFLEVKSTLTWECVSKFSGFDWLFFSLRTVESFGRQFDFVESSQRIVVDVQNSQANLQRYPLSSCELNEKSTNSKSETNFTDFTTWIIFPLSPKIIETDLRVSTLKVFVTNSVSVWFKFFIDELENNRNIRGRLSFIGKLQPTSALSECSITPSLSSSIWSWMNWIACRPRRSLSASVHKLKTPLQSKRKICELVDVFTSLKQTWIRNIVGNRCVLFS